MWNAGLSTHLATVLIKGTDSMGAPNNHTASMVNRSRANSPTASVGMWCIDHVGCVAMRARGLKGVDAPHIGNIYGTRTPTNLIGSE